MADKSQITMEEFRRSRARATPSAPKTGGKTVNDHQGKQTMDFSKKIEHNRPPSATKATTNQNDKVSVKTLEDRCERAKLLRDKQVEERKKKSEERKAAVEDRRRQKELEDNAKNETLRHLLEHKNVPAKGSGRKLPNLPKDAAKDSSRPKRESLATRRVSSGSSSGESPVHTPPGLSAGTLSSRRNLTGPSSASTSCLSSFGYSPKSNLGASKKASSSTSNLTDKKSSRPTSKTREKSVVSKALDRTGLPKAQSTGAIHQIGHSTGTTRSTPRPRSGAKKQKKQAPVHHAGTCTEEEAKVALAEHRKKVREEAERQALLDKEKQEKLRIEREAEDKRLAEEKAKEEARQTELGKLLKEQEDERARVLQEQLEKEEAERIVAEAKRKEEMELMKKMELERRAKEAERREREEEERLRKEEEERQERRKRVEVIMSRTRMTAGVNNNDMLKLEGLSEKTSFLGSPEHQSPTVSEILQKVKSRRSPNPEKDSEEKENDEWFDASDDNIRDMENGNMATRNDSSKLANNSYEKDDNMNDSSTHFVSLSLRQRDVTGRVANRTEADGLTRTEGDGEVSATRTNIMYTNNSRNPRARREDIELWRNVEGLMQSSENHAKDNLERMGANGDGEDDEDGEEGQLWKVVEGKREISEVV